MEKKFYCSQSASRRFQPGEGPSRGLLRDCTTSPINRVAALVETVSPGSDHTFAWRHVSCLTLIPPTRSNDGLQSASINQSRPNVSPQPSRRLENRKENKTDSLSSYLCLKTLPCCVNIFSQNLNFKSLKCWLQ